jgi:predicted AlkP superfamily pyrophosphatase or phosphodiesterase
MPRSSLRAAAVSTAVLVLAAACTDGGGNDRKPPGPPRGAPTVREMADRLGADVVEHLWRGYYPGRSADIAFVPEPGTTVVRWSGEGLGTDLADPRTTHPTPWDYHQKVPIVLYGPGYVKGGSGSTERFVRNPVDLTDIAPTFAALMGFDWEGPGSPLPGALLPDERWKGMPKVVVLVAYDGGGWNLLQEWPEAWPFQRRLMSDGTTYLNATIGSAPAVTSAIHANMGTGVYPMTHGMPEITGRLPDGSVADMWYEEITPRLLEAETVADAWDLGQDNRPWVGMIGYESWHLGMMSHGAESPSGADRDVGVLWEPEPAPGEFFTNEDLYALPGYLPGEENLDEHLRDLDGEDGAIDGEWMGWDLEDPAVIPGTPAFVNHQGDALMDMVEQEPIGEDGITDMLFVELKPTDFGGHLWNMVAPEEEFVLEAQDRVLERLVRALDRKVGGESYVLAVTADHGQTPRPETVGGLRVHPDILGRKVEAYFGVKLVQKVTPSGLFVDRALADRRGIALEDVARFVATFRYGDGLPADADRSAIPPEDLDRTVFAAALPSSFFEDLEEAEIDAFGASDYPEGDLSHVTVRIPSLDIE